MGAKVSRTDFEWSYTQEPHASRRKAIMEKHPEVKKLFGPDPNLKFIVLCMVIIQMISMYFVKDMDWVYIIIFAYCFGGVINHSMSLAIHEIAHNLAFGTKYPLANRALGIFANLPLGVPVSITFKKYHLEHHRFQGEDDIDVDIPTYFEAKFFNRTFTKFLWVILQPLFYTIRPFFIRPKSFELLELINIFVQFSFDAVVFYILGIKPIVYMIAGTLLATGLHPMAGHFISEHYMIKKGYETYSYYGCLNAITFNVGFHNEHHDFPYVAGSKLPALRKMAPEFYDNLPCHTSWVKVIYDFIFDPDIGPYSRIKRSTKPFKSSNHEIPNNILDL
ncbi:sphingolipid delta(4)-desaturase DES1-like [Octopus vulgaris]|uniref:sphingolipid 4-desaturase n=1 Tax=Octopus vulgaris TaxID=6645 RepID=A0AA36BCB3_OCTVU|nr:sphingolipid delta(4)-desaturase DES1-like [Octopus vulgaris]